MKNGGKVLTAGPEGAASHRAPISPGEGVARSVLALLDLFRLQENKDGGRVLS